MKKIMEIFAWTVALSVCLVVVFVKSPAVSGKSGGDQAGKIIETGGNALSKVIKSLQGS